MTLPNHHCPGCGAAQKPFPRYPWHFCNACRAQAKTGDDTALEFANVSMSGGFQWRVSGSSADDWTICTGVIALISGRPALIHEARFGGIVAEPLLSPPDPGRGVIDLTQPRRA